ESIDRATISGLSYDVDCPGAGCPKPRMPNSPSVNSRRAQTLVAVREMVLRGEFVYRKTVEEVELSRALGASRPIVRAILEQLHQEGLLEELSAGAYAPHIFSGQDIADAI